MLGPPSCAVVQSQLHGALPCQLAHLALQRVRERPDAAPRRSPAFRSISCSIVILDEAMLAAATITEQIATWATHVVSDLGLVGIFVLMLLDAACVPIPSEITMLFAGFSVSQGHDDLLSVTAAGVMGNLVGSWLAYYVGRHGRRRLQAHAVTRRMLSSAHLAAADRWFGRYGDASVLVGRLLPVVRTFISLPAGAAGVPMRRFSVLTVIGCIPWVLAFAWLGTVLGANWDSVKPGLRYADYTVLGLALLAVTWALVHRRSGRSC